MEYLSGLKVFYLCHIHRGGLEPLVEYIDSMAMILSFAVNPAYQQNYLVIFTHTGRFKASLKWDTLYMLIVRQGWNATNFKAQYISIALQFVYQNSRNICRVKRLIIVLMKSKT